MTRRMSIDAALPDMMSARGIAPGDQRTLMADVEAGDATALRILEKRMGLAYAPTVHETTLTCPVDLGGGVVWTGAMLRMPGSMPATMCSALQGRCVTDVIQHPALPKRTIASASSSFTEARTVLMLEPDMRPYTEFLGGCRLARLDGMRRRTMRRHRSAVGSGCHLGAAGLAAAAFAMLSVLLMCVLWITVTSGDANREIRLVDHPMTMTANLVAGMLFAAYMWSLPRRGREGVRAQWLMRDMR